MIQASSPAWAMASWTREGRSAKIDGGTISRSQYSPPRLMTVCWPGTLGFPEQLARSLRQAAWSIRLDDHRVTHHHVAGLRDVLVGVDDERHVLLQQRAGVLG